MCKHGNPGALTEEQKADEFRKMYVMKSPVKMKDIRAVAVCCNINVDALDSMPSNLRGYHDVYNENRTIYYKQGDAVSGIENTILHEIREMMEPHFVEVCTAYEPLDNGALHIAANRFASAVLLPRESFTNKVYETGLDVFELSNYYSKSCSQVLLRMGEVLNGKHFFYGALYERDSERDTWSLNYCTLSPSQFPETNFGELGVFFPTKGTAVAPGSLVGYDYQGRKGPPYADFNAARWHAQRGQGNRGLGSTGQTTAHIRRSHQGSPHGGARAKQKSSGAADQPDNARDCQRLPLGSVLRKEDIMESQKMVAIYARVSSDRQDVDLSISAQLKALREYAARNGYTVIKEFVDEAESGRSTARPAFREMISIARMKHPPFQLILVWKLSRFARNREDSIIYKSLLRKQGIQIVSINEPIEDTPTGRLMEGIIEVIDEFYSSNLA
jgi:predicted site-specific integrase-resolvase